MNHLFHCLLLGTGFAYAQVPARVSGYARDRATGENLIGVAVVQADTGQGTATNAYGCYSLTLPTAGLDSVRLVANYVGYARDRWAAPCT